MDVAIPPSTRRLLVVCPSWVGDTVMATPVLRAARNSLPEACIAAVMRPGLDELLAGAPWFDETIVAETKTLLAPFRIAADVRRRGRPDAALVLPSSLRSALLAARSGAAVRAGYDRSGRGLLLTHRVEAPPRGRPVSAVEYYAALAESALGVAVERRLELALTGAQRGEGARLLEGVERPFAVLVPGANRADKRWPPERFAAVAAGLRAAHGLACVATGSPAEAPVVAALVAAAAARGGTIHDLLRRGVGLGGLKAVIAEARLVVSNDTGPRLIAAALGTPVVSLFGPTDQRWTAFDCPHERRILADPFLPEQAVADRNPKRCAIDRITVGDVLAAARALYR